MRRLSAAEKSSALAAADYGYYEAENQRWPGLASSVVSDKWARAMVGEINALYNHSIALFVGCKGGYSFGWSGPDSGIELHKGASWLTLLHEISHAVGLPKHDEHHERMTSALARYVLARGYAEADMSEQFDEHFGDDTVNLDGPTAIERLTRVVRRICKG